MKTSSILRGEGHTLMTQTLVHALYKKGNFKVTDVIEGVRHVSKGGVYLSSGLEEIN